MADLLLPLAAAAAGLLVVWALARRDPLELRSRHPAPVAVLAAAAAAGAAVADGAPTGEGAVDLVLRVVLAAVVTVAGARARRRGLVLAAGLAAAASADDPVVLALAFAALGAAVAVAATRRSRVLGAAVGAAVANVLLRLSWPEAELATAALAAVVVAVLCLSALPQLRRRTRRRAIALGGLVLLLAAGAVAAYGAVGLGARDDVERAVAATNEGLDLAQAGDTSGAVRRFDEAAALLGHVDERISSWPARPLRYVPVAAQQARAVDGLVDAATAVLVRAADAVRVADLERVRPRDGRVDLAALASFEAPLEGAVGAFATVEERVAAVRSPWLLPVVERQLDTLTRRADEARRDSLGVLDAVRHLPDLLGAGGQRRWFLAVATPSELRGGGGFIGNWGILTATDGRLELPVFRRISDLYREEPYGVGVDPEFDARYLERFGLDRFPQNSLASPNLPSSGVVVRQVLGAAGEGPIDGVIVIDPFGVEALLELTGPIEVPGWPVPLTSENAASVLLHEQYLDAGREDREEFLSATTRVLFDALTSGDLPSPRVIGDVLGPVVAQKRIQVFAFDEESQAFVRRLGLDARLKRPIGDGIGLVAHNAAPSKVDWFLRRSVAYDLTVDESTGMAEGEVEVRLRNEAPADLPDNGYLGKEDEAGIGGSRLMMSLYTTLGLDGLTVDGEPLEPDPSRERGYRVYDRFVSIPPGGEVVLRYRLSGPVRLVGGRYRLDVHRQPTAAPDRLTVRVNGETLFDGAHDRDLVLETRL